MLDEAYAQANADVRPGPYVMIAVSDTGTGIPATLLEKVFEPFFTTKEVGKGTGLGLSMVYGFVKQSGGHIKIYSEEGHGTTIKIYLPRATRRPKRGGAAAVAGRAGRAARRSWWSRTTRWCATMSSRSSTSLGYSTLAAANAAEALAHGRRPATQFDLLFTDVIMPGGMNGRELADEIARRGPAPRCCSPPAIPRTRSCIMAASIRASRCSTSRIARRIWRRRLRQVLDAPCFALAIRVRKMRSTKVDARHPRPAAC